MESQHEYVEALAETAKKLLAGFKALGIRVLDYERVNGTKWAVKVMRQRPS